MNNSRITIDNALADEPQIDRTVEIRQRETELIAILEAIKALLASEYWQTLNQKVFSKEEGKLTSQLQSETDPIKMYRLQGELKALERYTLTTLDTKFRNELTNLKNQ